MAAAIAEPVSASVVRSGTEPIDAPALTRDGSRIAFQMMSKDDWEIYTINRDGTAQARVTREIQHDVLPVLPLARSDPRSRRRTAAPPFLRLRFPDHDPHAALPQQQRAHDCAGVFLAGDA